MQVVAVQVQPFGRDLSINPFSVTTAREALSDHMLMSALLHHASVHVDPHAPMTLMLHGRTIRYLSSCLKHDTKLLSDNTIATVGLLAATGVSR